MTTLDPAGVHAKALRSTWFQCKQAHTAPGIKAAKLMTSGPDGMTPQEVEQTPRQQGSQVHTGFQRNFQVQDGGRFSGFILV
ncbi:hypothetical protein TNCV_2504161 [Trichonephila clavipes]|nr:hypothetical protein TNCV_2504161 [Trichonephila clavipes]